MGVDWATSPNLCMVTCPCGHTADLEKFTVTPLGTCLAPDHYQCPACKLAWAIVNAGQAKVMPCGFVLPPERKLQPCDAVL